MEPSISQDDDEKGAAVSFPPPLMFLLLTLAAFGIHYLYPISIGIPFIARLAGLLITIAAIAVIIYINRLFAQAETNIAPWKPTTTIMTTGIYAYSRNPIYFLFCITSVGFGVIADSVWVVASFIPSVIWVYLAAIKKEEAYLEQKFGEEYLRYKNRVRCWL